MITLIDTHSVRVTDKAFELVLRHMCCKTFPKHKLFFSDLGVITDIFAQLVGNYCQTTSPNCFQAPSFGKHARKHVLFWGKSTVRTKKINLNINEEFHNIFSDDKSCCLNIVLSIMMSIFLYIFCDFTCLFIFLERNYFRASGKPSTWLPLEGLVQSPRVDN